MEGINIGDKIAFHITGNHNIGYAKGERYVGTVLSRDHRSRLHVRADGMPRACIDERDVDAVGLIMDNCLRGHGMRFLTLSMNLKTSLWIRGQKRMKLY